MSYGNGYSYYYSYSSGPGYPPPFVPPQPIYVPMIYQICLAYETICRCRFYPPPPPFPIMVSSNYNYNPHTGATYTRAIERSQPAVTKLILNRDSDQRMAEQLVKTWSKALDNIPDVNDIRHVYTIRPVSTAAFDRNAENLGNVKQYWHGTTRCCTLGDDPDELDFCSDSECSLCQILQSGYRTDKARSSGMLGEGVYSTPLSSKAARNTYMTTEPRKHATSPPAGYDSVSTKGGAGLVRNSETCVYDEDMITPAWLYLFEAP
ncbi:hypothetical protein R3P38DRAFT_3284407 [Favolaschia claudopus]|uniref:SCP domain-containing protein n=1 Tax=Favolaschia claudopus TaxID=2862362 RepID=A0AAW0A6M8_9AGAR